MAVTVAEASFDCPSPETAVTVIVLLTVTGTEKVPVALVVTVSVPPSVKEEIVTSTDALAAGCPSACR